MVGTRLLTLACTLGSLAPQPLAQKTPDVRLDVGDPPGLSEAVDVAIASGGDSVYAVWVDRRRGIYDVRFNRSLNRGRRWAETDTRLDLGNPFASHDPVIAAEGPAVYVAWVDERAISSRDIYFQRSLDGGTTWLSSEIRIDLGDLPGEHPSSLPAIATRGSEVFVAWVDGRGPSGSDVYVNRSSDQGSTWLSSSVRANLGVPASQSGPLGLAVTADAVHLAWVADFFGWSSIYYNRSADGGSTWLASSLQLDTPPAVAFARGPVLAACGSFVNVVWVDERNGGFDLYANHSSDGGATWMPSDAPIPATPAGAFQDRQALACTGSAVHLAWMASASGVGRAIWYQRSDDGGASWLPSEVRLDPQGAGSASRPSIVVDGPSVHVAWTAANPSKSDVFANRSLDGGQSWLPAEVRIDTGIPPNTANAINVELARSGTSVHAAWYDDRNGEYDVYFNLVSGHQPYGTGKPGTGGVVPTLAASGDVAIGGDLTIEVEGGLGGATGLLLHTFAGPASLSVAGGTLLLAPPIHQLPIQLDGTPGAAGAGSASVPVSVPLDLALLGQRVNVQAGLFDPGGVRGSSLTAALEFWVL